MRENKIDYKKLNERIVEQAYESLFVLSEQDKRKLIEDKFERARLYSDALQKSPSIWYTGKVWNEGTRPSQRTINML